MPKPKNDQVETIVYQIKNLVNGKIYIGITCRGLMARRSSHILSAKRGKSFLISRAIRKYGNDSFEFSAIETFSTFSGAAKREIEIIADRKPAYNITTGGEGSPGHKMSDRVKAIIRASNARREWPSGFRHSVESRAKMLKNRDCIRRPVRCLWDMREFNSIKSAARYYGVSASGVSAVCLKRYDDIRDLKFEFIQS